MWRAVGDIGSRERLWLATGGSKRGQRVREGVIGVPKARYLHRYDMVFQNILSSFLRKNCKKIKHTIQIFLFEMM